MRKLSTAVAIFGSLSIALVSPISIVQAQVVSLNVSPMVTITKLNSSQAKASFSVTNEGQAPLRVRIYAQDFDYDREDGYRKIGDHPYSAKPYVQFSPRELVVAPGVTRDVRVNVIIPPSRPDGEYRVAIFTQDLTERKIDGSNTKLVTFVRPQIASIFFITKGSQLPKLSAESVGWNLEGTRPRLVFKNIGAASAYLGFNWQLKQGDREISRNEVSGVVLQAGKERAVDININPATKLAPGNYTLVGEIENNNDKKVPFSLSLTVPRSGDSVPRKNTSIETTPSKTLPIK